jgi:hypothetical protein
MRDQPIRSRTLFAAALTTALGLAGCASTQVDAQWRNVELPPGYLRGATVLVSCESPELVVKQICEDRVIADLNARGVNTQRLALGAAAASQPGVLDAQYLPLARANGAKAVFAVTVGLSTQSVSQGVSVGIGGFGFGRGAGGGVGVSAPIGGGQVSQGYSASGRVTDAASGRLMWTARANAPPSTDVNAQFTELSKSVVEAAAGAGLF